jgi:hypothetical protein
MFESYRYRAGQFAYVYFLWIFSLKSSQSLLNMRSKVTAASYFHSGVIDTAVHVTAVSMTPLCRVQPSQISL